MTDSVKLDPSWDDVPNGITKDTKQSTLDPSWDDVPDGLED